MLGFGELDVAHARALNPPAQTAVDWEQAAFDNALKAAQRHGLT